MKNKLLLKALSVAVIVFVIYIPLMMISSLVYERKSYRNDAIRSIAEDSVGEQQIAGPILVIPYLEVQTVEEVDNTKNLRKVKTINTAKELLIFPEQLKIAADVDVDQRYRGIHKVWVYSSIQNLSGNWQVPALADLLASQDSSIVNRLNGKPYVSVGMRDTRGLNNLPKITVEQQQYSFSQQSGLAAFTQGIHADLSDLNLTQPQTLNFKLDLLLGGMEKLSFIPLARDNQVSLKSSWLHPQYFGRFLPTPKSKVVNEKGFAASWSISALASNAQQQILTEMQKPGSYSRSTPDYANSPEYSAASSAGMDSFGVGFIEPVNVYALSDRATKYGLMFVVLTFAAFMLYEVLLNLRIHAVQYGLVGFALVMFFLLLISLAEKIEFIWAYLIASLACISLITYYVAAVLASWRRAMGMTLGLSVLYGALYGLLHSEGNALILGSGLLFAILAAVMMLTRRVNWYQLRQSGTAEVVENAAVQS